jgi:hypothetical protein
MSSDTWGAATFALGVLATAHSAAVFGEARPPARAVVWMATSSDKVKSVPTLPQRSLSSLAAAMRTAELRLVASASGSAR